jgi:ketosteroid isomerase-like protein
MASGALALVKSIYAAWERGDFSSAAWAHPEIETVVVDGPVPGSWTGVAGMAEAFREFAGVWEEFRQEVEEFRDLGHERVLVLSRRRGRGKRSGIDLEQIGSESAVVWHVQEGKVTRQVYYFDREHAFADLGLASEADPPRT